jgi:hypothetical protein
LYGQNGDDVIDGGRDADYLEGNSGDDTYVFRSGSGQDTINNYDGYYYAFDTIQFENVAYAEGFAGLYRTGNDLIISYGDSDSVTIQDHYANFYNRLEQYNFTAQGHEETAMKQAGRFRLSQDKTPFSKCFPRKTFWKQNRPRLSPKVVSRTTGQNGMSSSNSGAGDAEGAAGIGGSFGFSWTAPLSEALPSILSSCPWISVV